MLPLLRYNQAANVFTSPCDNSVRIQLVQVQDGTDSFSDDAVAMRRFMEEVVQGVDDKFEGPLDYALTSFTDKPQIITGFGWNAGVYRDYAGYTDHCYKKLSSLSRDVNMDGLTIGGGKDGHENQLDALAMAAVDPTMGWVDGDRDEDGNMVVKLAVLVTDAGHHRASAVDTSPEKRNWYFEELFGGPCDYTEKDTCTEDFGITSSRTGVALSLTGVLGFYQHFKIGADVELLTRSEYVEWEHAEEFNAYRFCCTNKYGVWPQPYYNRCDKYFSTYEKCAAVSCEYCTGSGCKEVCTEERGNIDFSVDWMKTIETGDIEVTPYVYGPARFNKDVDCSTMEYPDPFSQEYADVFLKSGVSPVFFIRQPAGELHVDPTALWPFMWDVILYGNQTCPIAGQRLFKYWLCHSDPSRRKERGITTVTNACDNYDPNELDVSNWYGECFDEHYGEMVNSLKEKGVSAYYLLVDNTLTGKELLDEMGKFISHVVEQEPACHSTTAVPKTSSSSTIQTSKPTTLSTLLTSSAANSTESDETSPPLPPLPPPPTLPNPQTQDTVTADEDETNEYKSEVPIIVGSAAGGLATACIGAVLWARGLLPGTNTVDVSYSDEAAREQEAQEREQVQHVDHSMFL